MRARLAAALLAGIALTALAAAGRPLTILYTNDLHVRLDRLTSLREHLEEIKQNKLRVALESDWEVVERNVAMVTLKRDLECPLSLDQMVVRAPDAGRLLAFFEELEFDSMARELREPDLFS